MPKLTPASHLQAGGDYPSNSEEMLAWSPGGIWTANRIATTRSGYSTQMDTPLE
jgi:hypothetical protein